MFCASFSSGFAPFSLISVKFQQQGLTSKAEQISSFDKRPKMSFGSGFGGGYQDMGGGGGGFMTDSPSDSSQNKKRQRDSNQSLLPVTVAMLHKAEYDKGQEIFRFDNIELHQVTVVGVIREVQESATNMLYKVDDMTGDSIIVRKWIDTEENSSEAMKRSQCREDTYVRVYGHLKSFQETRSLIAFTITPVKDFNEITFHMLDVVHGFLSLTKGKATLEAAGGAGAAMGSPGRSMTGMGTTAMRGMGDAFGGGQGSGMSKDQQQVLDAICSYHDEQGISIQQLKQKLRNLSEQQMRVVIDFLSNEGHIYSTIDDDHFRSTAM